MSSANGHANGALTANREKAEALRADRRLFENPAVKKKIEEAVAQAEYEMETFNLNTATAGIISADGRFASPNEYFMPGLQVSQHGNIQRTVIKSVGKDEPVAAESQLLGESDDDMAFDPDRTIPPPWDFDALQTLLISNTIHSAAIETKAADYAYSGWRLNQVPEVTQLLEDHVISEDELSKCEDEVRGFLDTLLQGRPVEDMCRDLAIDFETIGMCGFEMVRKKNALLDSVYVVPARTMRHLREKSAEWEKGARMIQSRFNKKRYFGGLGYNVEYVGDKGKNFDPLTANVEDFPGPSLEVRKAFIKFAKKKLFNPEHPLKAVTKPEKAATEMVTMNRRPLTISETYGTPAGISAYGAMLALQKIENYNLDFFDTKGVPQYAIILKKLQRVRRAPIKASDGTIEPNADPTAQLRNTIAEFFQKRLSMGNRSVLTLQLFGDTEVQFERLSADTLDASFAEYEARAREMIRLAHRMPPAALGIAETANLGAGRDTSQMRRYRDHIVVPGQRDFASLVNIILRVGLLLPYFKFEFVPITLEEETALRDYYLNVAKGGYITEDELLSRVPGGFPERGEDGGGDRRTVPSNVTVVGGIDDVEDLALVLDHQRKRWEEKRDQLAQDLAYAESGDEREED